MINNNSRAQIHILGVCLDYGFQGCLSASDTFAVRSPFKDVVYH